MSVYEEDGNSGSSTKRTKPMEKQRRNEESEKKKCTTKQNQSKPALSCGPLKTAGWKRTLRMREVLPQQAVEKALSCCFLFKIHGFETSGPSIYLGSNIGDIGVIMG